jgi:anti-sigma factor RsiW
MGTAGCPDPTDLLRSVLGEFDHTTEERIASHLRDCAACQDALSTVRQTVDALRAGAAHPERARTDCLDEFAIASFLDGTAAVGAQHAAASHILTCAHCAQTAASVARLRRDPDVVAELRHLTSPASAWRGRYLLRTTAIAGAAAVLALVLVRQSLIEKRDNAPIYRDRSVVGTSPLTPISPVGAVSVVDSLRWTSVGRADRYRVIVYDPHGTTVWEAQTRDTVAALPSAISRRLAGSYLWKVSARVAANRWVESDLAEFAIRSRGPPPR